MIGKTISHYKIIKKIGEGGMGVVYKAQDTRLDRRVALKFLPEHLLCDEEAKTRFVQEAKAASALNHTNIATIYEIDEVEDQCFISMEHIEGKSIKQLLKGKALSVKEILGVAIQIAEGLNAAHKKDIVHRDIKSDNIMLTDDGVAKIMDFGLAKLKGVTKLTKTGTTLGTMQYMSPEQAQGMEVDQRADIFSFGVILYEMITGQLPFKGEYEAAVIHSIVNETPEPLARYKANVPEGLQRIIDKAVEKNREMRYQHADDLGTDLRKLKTELETGITKTLETSMKITPSIAVLPFINLSADPEQEYFCDGMAEEIINALTHVEGLRVVARTSAFSFRGKEVDIREIGHKLNVETLLEGSVRKAANRVRITAQLVNVADGYHLWSEKYDREMEDVFSIQDEISLAIVDNLKVKLLKKEKAAIVKRHTEDQEAYNLYLKGRYYWPMFTAEGYERAVECFEQAIRKDPDFPLPYFGLGMVYVSRAYFGNLKPHAAYLKAKEYTKKALEIDHSLGEALNLSAYISAFYEWDWETAEREFKQALKLNPNSADIHENYSKFLTITRRHKEAVVEARRAQELDPLSSFVQVNAGQLLYFAGRYDEAIEDLQTARSMAPHFFLPHLFFGFVYLAQSKPKEAFSEFEKAVELSGGTPYVVSFLIYACYKLNKKARAEKLFESLKERAQHDYVPPTCFFIVHLLLGELDPAANQLERACEERDSFLLWILATPREELRENIEEPRFKNILEKYGLKTLL